MRKLLLFTFSSMLLCSVCFGNNGNNDETKLEHLKSTTYDSTVFTVIWSFVGDQTAEWFTDGTESELSYAFAAVERGIVYNSLTNHVYISSRHAEDNDGDGEIDTSEPHIYILDPNTGQAPAFGIDRFITDGITSADENYGGGYCLNNVTVSDDGSIFACNMTLASGPYDENNNIIKAFRVYYWSWEQALPEMIIDYQEGGYRLGDKFSVLGDWDTQAYIYAVPGENTKMIRWSVSGGIVNSTPEIVTLQDITSVATSGTVADVPGHDDWVYVSGKGFLPTLFSTDGVNLTQVAITPSELPGSVLAGRTIEFNGKIYMAMWCTVQRAFVMEVSSHGENVTDADVIGITPTFGSAYGFAYGEGAVEFGVINDSLNVFAVGPSNGYARFRIDDPGIYTHVEKVETDQYKLSAYPNPANDELTVGFTLPENAYGAVAVKMFDMSGRFLGIIPDEATGGYQEVKINVSQLPQGMYMYQVVYKDTFETGKISIN